MQGGKSLLFEDSLNDSISLKIKSMITKEDISSTPKTEILIGYYF